jgi:hypothetical protein
LGNLSIFLEICCRKNPSKNPFYEKVKMFKKGPFVLESFIIVGLFDCDRTQLEVGGKPKAQGKH